MQLVDVAINVYGKPNQTLVAILSLLKQSGEHIDKVYFVEELKQPHNDTVKWIFPIFNKVLKNRWVYFQPALHLGCIFTDRSLLSYSDYRLSIRYQYAWENTNKNYLFICHNDCFFNKDIIGGMLDRINQNPLNIGVGRIGQCWNCPAKYAKVCDGDLHDQYNPTYDEAKFIYDHNPHKGYFRTNFECIDKISPMPFPECRLNEFGCLICVEKIKNIVCPCGPVRPFGSFGLDIGCDWFRELKLRGYKFINWHEGMVHNGGGHQADDNRELYFKKEAIAAEYLRTHYDDNYDYFYYPASLAIL